MARPTTVIIESDPQLKVNIVRKHSPKKKDYISEEDKDMDRRVEAAVSNAIKKAKVCGKAITVYDKESRTVSIEYADGRKEEIK